MSWTVQFIIKVLSAFAESLLVKTSSFWSFIVSFYSLIRLLSHIVSSEELFIVWYQYFQL